MQVLADRAQTGGLRLLQYDSELFLLFSLLVQGTSLATNGASLAESLYGLRRTSAAAAQRGHAHSLSIKQLLLSCFFLVCYINICDIHVLSMPCWRPGLWDPVRVLRCELPLFSSCWTWSGRLQFSSSQARLLEQIVMTVLSSRIEAVCFRLLQV